MPRQRVLRKLTTITISLLGKRAKNLNSGETLDCYIMILPQILGFLVFMLYPLCWALRNAWYYFDGTEASYMFTGLENFKRVFADPKYWNSLGNSFLLMFGKLPLEFTLAITLALAINKKLKGSSFFRNVYFLPNIISAAIIGLIFSNIFASFGGVANAILQNSNFISGPIDWFANKNTAMLVIILASTWQSFGINILYILAALQNVPVELYESIKIDGASGFQTFIYVTLPMIAPVLSIILMLAINGTLQTTDLVLVLTNGNPGGSTEVVMTYVLKNVVRLQGSATGINIGYGASMGIVTSVILAFVTLVYMGVSKKARNLY